jgi:hypothetical protein
MLPRISGGKPNTIISAITRMYQAYSGILCSAMPLVRVRRIETTSSTPALTAEISTKVMPSSQKSELTPGMCAELDSGVYMNQPAFGATPRNTLDSRMMPPNR